MAACGWAESQSCAFSRSSAGTGEPRVQDVERSSTSRSTRASAAPVVSAGAVPSVSGLWEGPLIASSLERLFGPLIVERELAREIVEDAANAARVIAGLLGDLRHRAALAT